MERVLFVDECDVSSIPDLCAQGHFRCVGVMRGQGKGGGRRWILVRPGIVPSLSLRTVPSSRRVVWVFDLNRVLGYRWHDETGNLRAKIEVNIRIGRSQAVLFRPGARKLLRLLHAAGHEVWLWSTMQHGSVLAWRDALAEFVPDDRCLCGSDCPEPDLKDLRIVRRRGGYAEGEVDVCLIDDDSAKGRLDSSSLVVAPAFEPRSPFDPVAVSDSGLSRVLGEILKRIGKG